ncbi:hypothetical protein A3K63_00960 [Candidatus Micrarchaeota archaeon RBG_16_49_10]|nr:MAG: hypothetical protein A3K63_00960 [Candidatus Micrarchaeota archaeon RBG_16_49_10]
MEMIEKTRNLAEIFGIMTGDGCIYVDKRRKVYQTTVSGHLSDDYEYLVNYVKPLFEQTLGFSFHIKRYKNFNGIALLNQNRSLVFLLENFGLKRGNKINNNLGIPDWVSKNTDFMEAFLRGLIDTDGSVYCLPKRDHPCISLKTKMPKLMVDFSGCMKVLGIRTTKWTFGSETPQIYIYDRAMVKKFKKVVGFKNIKHIKRYESFMKAPVV